MHDVWRFGLWFADSMSHAECLLCICQFCRWFGRWLVYTSAKQQQHFQPRRAGQIVIIISDSIFFLPSVVRMWYALIFPSTRRSTTNQPTRRRHRLWIVKRSHLLSIGADRGIERRQWRHVHTVVINIYITLLFPLWTSSFLLSVVVIRFVVLSRFLSLSLPGVAAT